MSIIKRTAIQCDVGTCDAEYTLVRPDENIWVVRMYAWFAGWGKLVDADERTWMDICPACMEQIVTAHEERKAKIRRMEAE